MSISNILSESTNKEFIPPSTIEGHRFWEKGSFTRLGWGLLGRLHLSSGPSSPIPDLSNTGFLATCKTRSTDVYLSLWHSHGIPSGRSLARPREAGTKARGWDFLWGS